jgi:Tfp pilus assembly protein FimT
MAFIKITIDQQELRNMEKAMGDLFPRADQARVLGAIMRKAVKPALEKLKQVTPQGPTGNLLRAARSKVVTYSKTGVAVGLIGYNRAGQGSAVSAQGGNVLAGPDRAFHQWWLENGTKDRVIKNPTPVRPYARPGFTRGAFQRNGYTMTRKGKTFAVRAHQIGGHAVAAHSVQNFKEGAYYYASSFNRLGPFKIRSIDGKTIATDPAYPQAFFKKSKSPIILRGVPVGGLAGRKPVETAFRESQQAVAEILQRELRLTLEQAIGTITRSVQGTVST